MKIFKIYKNQIKSVKTMKMNNVKKMVIKIRKKMMMKMMIFKQKMKKIYLNRKLIITGKKQNKNEQKISNSVNSIIKFF